MSLAVEFVDLSEERSRTVRIAHRQLEGKSFISVEVDDLNDPQLSIFTEIDFKEFCADIKGFIHSIETRE